MQPHKFYSENIQKFQIEVASINSSLRILRLSRFVTFLSLGILIYFQWRNSTVTFISLGIGTAIFLFLVSKYSNLKKRAQYHRKLIEINEQEICALEGDFSALRTGDEYISDTHYFNQDIDLFGKNSLFQLINRSELKKGEQLLAGWLNSNNIDDIPDKQEIIKELAKKAKWRQHFKTSAALIQSEIPSNTLLNWLSNYTPFTPKLFRILPLLFSIFSIANLALYTLGYLSGTILLCWFLTGIFITAPYVKRITNLYNVANKMKDTFAQYASLLEALETETFTSKKLQNQQGRIITQGLKASSALKNLSRQIDYLGNRNNMIFAPLGNGFLLWDIYFAYRIEKWIDDYNKNVQDWFEVIEFFDAMNSLGNMAYNHPTYIYPTISVGNHSMCVKSIGHPLIHPKKLITNDITINKEDFFIITGANMAGKSTFLRTVAVNLVMANCGLPVCASSFDYRPVKLISSMRTSDSLSDEASYFFSELTRLKFIVDSIQNDDYFIILDEILKGTNSKDKAEGSQKFVERLVASNSTGLIATHDLSLCQLSEKLPQVQNHYFDAEIIDDELFFDYTFKKGICQNMNASFLLKKMGIVE